MLPRRTLLLTNLPLIPQPLTKPQRIRLVQIRVRMTLAPKVLRGPLGRWSRWGVSGGDRKEVKMARTSRSQWRALSRRTVVIRSLTACAAGAAAALALVKATLGTAFQ